MELQWQSLRYTPRPSLSSPRIGAQRNQALAVPVGKGYVLYESQSPAALTYLPNGGNVVYNLVQRGAKSAHLPLKETNALILRRGPYVIAAGMDNEPGITRPGIRPIRDR